MENDVRYAVYYAPEAGSRLSDFGAQWLGWDADTGRRVAHPRFANLPRPVAQLTATPRKYGFHGTLKPPFKLAKGTTVASLQEHLESFAVQQPAFRVDQVGLRSLGGFVAITPTRPSTQLAALAASCVRRFDPFRAPPSDAELARRRIANLSDAQEKNLRAWGYPYVFDAFRFHLTLTGQLAPEVAANVVDSLQPHVGPMLSEGLPINDVCLFCQNGHEGFHILKRFPLKG